MADKCPICFSDIGTWTDDPILTTNPAPSIINYMTNPNILITYEEYKGFTQLKAQHIKELQDNRRQLETDLVIIPLTAFSVVDTTNLFQNMETYIYELRVSTEKILTEVGMAKDTYFNYDEDGNDMRVGNHQVDWTDIPFPVGYLRQFQSKAAHIEDLRHFIEEGYFKENWELSVPTVYTTTGYFTGEQSKSWVRQIRAFPLGSYVEIEEIDDNKDVKLSVPIDSSSAEDPAIYIKYWQVVGTRFKAAENCKLYFDVNNINIVPSLIYYEPGHVPAFSVDNFSVKIMLNTYYASPGASFNITYYYNYDPAWFKSLTGPFPLEFYEILKGNLAAPISVTNNLYDDMISVWLNGTLHPGFPSQSGPNYIFKSYYDGTIDTKGCYVYSVDFAIGGGIDSGTKVSVITLDNIKIKV